MMLLVVIVPPRNSQKHVYHHHIPIQQSNRVETEKNMEYFSESTMNSQLPPLDKIKIRDSPISVLFRDFMHYAIVRMDKKGM